MGKPAEQPARSAAAKTDRSNSEAIPPPVASALVYAAISILATVVQYICLFRMHNARDGLTFVFFLLTFFAASFVTFVCLFIAACFLRKLAPDDRRRRRMKKWLYVLLAHWFFATFHIFYRT